ncbi:prepilin-type N-terminal cleavage/methylation domain protein [delta proteobacterium NaphS2]|nr:prepilin-type N-terminal cleavage/methylation domain protein [delta proteobacterium NaphS2]
MTKGRHSEKPLSKAASGFALVEILVAISILAISLVVIFQLFSGGLKSRQLSEKYARGVFYAREKMAETLILPELLEGESAGELEGAYRWQSAVTRIVPEDDEEELPVDLMKIYVRVTWREGERDKSFTIETLKVVGKEQSADNAIKTLKEGA